MKASQGISNAKIILMGEHSVVYGKSAIALPFFAAEVVATIEESDNGVVIISDYYEGKLEQVPDILKGVQQLIQTIITELDINRGLKITLDSKIPAQRGFGSSAAVSVAIIKAFYKFTNKNLDINHLKDLVSKTEKIHHDNPSGLDGDTIILKRAIYFIKEQESTTIRFNMDMDLIVGDTGVPASTKTAVQLVASQPNKEKYINNLGVLSEKVLENIKNKDSLSMGENMTQAQEELRSLGVSTEMLDKLVNTALSAGALGAKLSGGGLGGCMIALSEKNNTQTIIQALKNQGASSTWVLDLKEI